MNTRIERQARLDGAIIVDEIGLESGCYGIYRLRCRYQPVFARRGQQLDTVAVAGAVSPFVAGEEAPWDLFLSAVAEKDLDFVEEMGLALQVRNLGNIALDRPDSPELLLNIEPGSGGAEDLIGRSGLIAREAAEADLDPGLVLCSIPEAAIADASPDSRLADHIRGYGMRITLADFGMGRWTDEQIAALDPDVVRIDGDWFRTVCRDAVTIRLFESVMARLRERRCRILISGIETEQQLGVALRAGADLLQGDHLAPGVQVGMQMPETVPLRSKLGNEKLISLYG